MSVSQTAVLAARCAACHEPGVTRDGVPSIAGRPAREIADKLSAYRAAGPKRDVMTTRASRLSDADIDALARYYAALPPVRRPD
ncbi:c-type cytochrome [Hansschlegelia sp. KR7-227]|uniref:c-type cytochrome n=1 Tax=Hansschlegelia sp. KR7-227 TaxID=3400914 RepID=UPI003C0C8D80